MSTSKAPQDRIEESALYDRWHVRQHPKYGHWCVYRQDVDGGSSSIGCGDSREAAEAKYAEFAAVGRCGECDDVLNDGYCEPYKTKIRQQQRCMSCLFWLNYVASASDPTHCVIDGGHFIIKPDGRPDMGSFYGHGGARFDIRFHDGREIVSHNLWAQGRIPRHFRERLPDNAVFVKRGHRTIGAFAGYGGAGSADADCEW